MDVVIIVLAAAGYIVLLEYLIRRWRPLKGRLRIIFRIAAFPIFIIFLVLNTVISFQLFPEIMRALTDSKTNHSSKGFSIVFLLLTTPLPSFVVWLWHQVLVTFQKRSVNKDLCPLLAPEELDVGTIETHITASTFCQVSIFRKKELLSPSEYFLIVLNGSVVAALKSHEYTQISLEKPVNQIGCYAIPSRERVFKDKYKYNSHNYVVHPGNPLALLMGSDIFVGSTIEEIDFWKAEDYKAKFTYIVRPEK